MSEPEQKRLSSLEFLEQMEVRHEQLLREVDELSRRIQQVLNDYSKSRGRVGDDSQLSTPAASTMDRRAA